MALLFMDGFDHYASADVGKKWSTSGGTIFNSGGRRTGAIYLGGPGTRSPAKTLATSKSTLIVGFAHYISSNSPPLQSTFDFYDTIGGGVQLQVYITSDGRVNILRGGNGAGFGPPAGTNLGFSNLDVFKFNSWQYLECKATFHNTAGSVEVRLNGQTVLNLTGIDTQNTANAYATQIALGSSASGGTYYDDLYICDDTGPAPLNTFLGDVRIDTLLPNADGTYQAWTPSTGTPHYAVVDENPMNTTDYVQTAGVGNRDSYGFQDLPAVNGSILAVQTNIAATKNDAGNRSIKSLVKSGATVVTGTAQAVSSSYLFYSDVYPNDPNTSTSWTQANVNAAEFGIESA